MHIQLNTDNTVESHAPLVAHVETIVAETLQRFSERISRVEIHLSLINDHKHSGGEHKCVMEARIEGHPPIIASDHAISMHHSIHGAVNKLRRAIESTFGRINVNNKNGDAVNDTDPQFSS
ncbi:HPF/RaiA family ribosome-associated protein [Solimicrobium silvestre]|uniref:Sigma 54 modulation protein / S30EA ribosomal protein n=1 Tax=Solimicrobium silvestre TaxID=2099400 RepID=A0A2S9GTL5_9BURK|nr:HPF/RaiA family ribosome-associated protein [Solimicrobium silvestre]PRC91053.1 Sigma 54 modulation protein / S30EA ribosomal protein [Solimicrobium silvestre]